MAKRRRQTKTGGGSRRHITKQAAGSRRSGGGHLPAAAGQVPGRFPLRVAVLERPHLLARLRSPPPRGRRGARRRRPSVRVRDEHTHLRVASPGDTAPRPSPCAGCPRVFSGAGGACGGPILVGRSCKGEFFVCNPSTGSELRLPPRLQPWYFHGAGLGYDGGEDRHKAVLLELGAAGHVPRLQCSVVTVGGPWSWRAPRGQRTMPIISDDAIVAACTDPVFADGRLHWMLLNGARGHLDGVLSFELGSEAFRRLPLPPPFADENLPGSDRETMAELDGRLCLVRDLSYPRRDVAVFEVWMLRDYNHPLSWSLDRRIDLTPHIGKQLTRLWEGEFFVVCYTGGQSSGESRKIVLATTGFAQRAYVYEPDTGELRTLVCWVDYGVQPQLRLVLHQGSLLQVDGMEYHNKDIKFTFTDERRISAPRYVSLFDY
ncbi:hypothetical protein EJB05_04872, partial [Eragrostis curvula]